MSSLMPVGAGALLRHPSFLSFLLSRSFSRFASQIGAVAIGWQVYDLTGSAFRSRHDRTGAIPADRAVAVRGGPRRRPLRAQARRAALPDRGSADGAVSRLGRLCRLAHGDADFHRDLRARDRGRVRKPGPGRAAAADRADRARCSGRPRSRAARRRSPPSPVQRLAGSPMPSPPALPTASWRRFALFGAGVTGAIRLAQPAVVRDTATSGRFVRRRQIRPQQSGDPRHDLARPVRRAARRRHRAAADLCARHPRHRPARPRHPARRARGRRAVDDGVSGAPHHQPPRRECGCSRP